MFYEEDLIPISALQHYVFCPRQCALIHIEQLWIENLFTAEGRGLHERVHSAEPECRDGIRIVRGLRLRSLELGLAGQADMVEFHNDDAGMVIPNLEGRYRLFPVEFKRGKPKIDLSDEVQLCAQAICLEEMLGAAVTRGALFYGRPRRRKEIDFTDTLRRRTKEASVQLHQLFQRRQTPKAKYTKKCRSCSLINLCMPKITGIRKDIQYYLSKAGLDD